MKKLKIVSVSICLAYLVSGSNVVLAETCSSIMAKGRPVHCVDIQGLSNDRKDGRFIKLESNQFTITSCVSAHDMPALTIDQADAAGLSQGMQSIILSICTDMNGTNCQKIATDNFNLQGKDYPNYIAVPQIFSADFSGVMKNSAFPKCASNG
jgi:hypothetical protein